MNPNSDRMPLLHRLGALLGKAEMRRRYMAVAVAMAVCLAAFIGFGAISGAAGHGGFEAGKVADHDVVAERDVIYVDAKATAARVDAERRLVPAVFHIDEEATRESLEALQGMKKAFVELAPAAAAKDQSALRLKSRFPDLDSGLLERLVDYPSPASALEQARLVLERLLNTGVFAVPETGLEPYNPEAVELRRWNEGPVVYEQVAIETITTMRGLRASALDRTTEMRLSAAMGGLVADLAAAFAKENAYFDAAQSARRLDSAAARIEPVMRRISKGEKVIRKGFIVTSGDLERLAALRGPASRIDPLHIVGGGLLLLMLAAGAMSVLDEANAGARLDWKNLVFVLALAAGYFVATSALAALLPPAYDTQFEALLPTALLSILASILVGERFAILFTLFLSASLPLSVGFESFVMLQALVSGVTGIVLVRRAEKRIDLVRAGAQLAIARFATGFALAALADRGFMQSLETGFWSSMNGFVCGVLALALLPVLEQTLNAPTVFRLQELSDLNAPALKRLLAVAPGTYSHSVTVAHLAESACREIGADALLARVGAYYHDIGKIEKPEYYIENQSGYNKHDDINPRLSATVIRGHVKFGLERAEQLGLPEPVKAIIAEHHGTSLISYFYDRAQRKSGAETSSEEYRYPGPLPSSREAAVVMLADCVEAASRTMKRPTLGKLEQYVKELVMDRHESGQLAMSKLTFHDLGLIRSSFVRVLSGHFHSRIEYPKAREQA
jgi:putative nucleotidyltransferase with HDIG domain